MPTNEPLQNFEIPSLGDSPDVPTWIANMVRDLIGIAVPRYVSEAARDLAIPTPEDGQRAITGTAPTTREWMGQGGQWVETFPLYGDWQTITPAPGWEGFSGDLWWVRREGEWAATNNILLRRVNGQNLTMSAGQSYTLSSAVPSNVLPVAGIRGPYAAVKVRGNVDTDGLFYWDGSAFRVIPSVTVTLTGGSVSQYVAVDSRRWLLKVPETP
jgi:hypothetical protein